MNIQFLGYTPTPNEKHLGIASVKIHGIILKYKIVPTKDGKGSFPCAPSYKITDEQGERYVSAFMLDSVSENEEIITIIKQNVRKYMDGSNSSNGGYTSNQQSGPVHRPSEAAQPRPIQKGYGNRGAQNNDNNVPF